MRARLPFLLVMASAPAWASSSVPAVAPPGPALDEDSVLQDLLKEALAKRPELAGARAQIAAEKERIPQSQALPDPTLALGIQNDGFGSIQIGKMETSYLSVMASQAFPWPGKRSLRGQVAEFGAREAELDAQRVALSVRAEVERSYLDLLLVRDQLGLLAKLETLWSQSEGLARVRYEAGEAAQSDLLRAQLERGRLRQRRWALQAEEQRRITVLNRLRGHPLTDPIATNRSLADLPDPVIADVEQAILTAEGESPELKRASLLGRQADQLVALAKKERWPDLTVSAGVMPRGSLEPMWTAGVAFNLPVWSAHKQARAVAENQARGQAARSAAEAVRQILQQRVRERQEALKALVEANRLYRSGLLVQSEATVTSTLVQYQVSKLSFASVLEAVAGYVADVNGFFDSIAAAQQVAIAEREISLDAPSAPSASPSGMGGSAMPGAGASPAGRMGRSVGKQESGGESTGASMSRM